MEWLPETSVTAAPVRSAIARWAGGGIIRSSAVTRYQLGLIRQAACRPAPVITAPPWEWPARTTGPSSSSMTRRVTAVSSSRDRIGFCTTATR